MKQVLGIAVSFLACFSIDAQTGKARYSSLQLEQYLDSVGHLSAQQLMQQASAYADSVFRYPQSLESPVSNSDLSIIKQACDSGLMDTTIAKRIFPGLVIDTENRNGNNVDLSFIPLDNKALHDLFAVSLVSGYGRSCQLYFFRGNAIISKHNIYHHYGLELEHYKDETGKTVCYYKVAFMTGTGIWWFQYNFYRYEGNLLRPILSELQNANYHYGACDKHLLWLESTIISKHPLTIKMVYYQEIPKVYCAHLRIVNDSTVVTYHWNAKSQLLEGDYRHSKLSRQKIFTYYLNEDELLFIRTYYSILKGNLRDKKKRGATLHYLRLVRGGYGMMKI